MDEHDLAALRREYAAGGLTESDLEADPIAMFRRWLRDASEAGLHEPNAMVVASADADGVPSARLVLLKGLDDRGFVFYTNYTSRKGRELRERPACALLFPWHDLERQVRVDGTATPLTEAENAAYFSRRPRGSQLGAWASPQSSVVASREELDERYAAVAARFGAGGDGAGGPGGSDGSDGAEVPVPPHWGGFRVTPLAVEFWQGRPGRMHDRLRYRRAAAGSTVPAGSGGPGDSGGAGGSDASASDWVVERLAP